jgi:hypothetical protein
VCVPEIAARTCPAHRTLNVLGPMPEIGEPVPQSKLTVGSSRVNEVPVKFALLK